jgi:MinD superfamily P-loop ATPase
MKSIIVLSGKGGVGKSSITASLAVSFAKTQKIVCADCDVDGSNLAILFSILPNDYKRWTSLSTNQIAEINKNKCIGCKKCVDFCYFNALEFKDNHPQLKEFSCEGCGVCELICPVKEITLKNIDNAYIGESETNYNFKISSAQLLPGNSGSGKVVYSVKENAKKISKDAEILIIDSAAGIGCPVIASVTGCDYAVIVTEPTPSGYEDMLRALEIINHFKIKKGIIINKYDINKDYYKKIENYAKENKIQILEKIPFDKKFVEAMVNMTPLVIYEKKYEIIFDNIKNKIKNEIEL